MNQYCCAGRVDRSLKLRAFLTADRHDNDSQSDQESDGGDTEEVIVISLGVVNECPGMESEQKVNHLNMNLVFLKG